ncbi:ribosomal protein S18 [Annulohypoxylon truncatum]|uniref:ribosomal protein S18 n=1 Tax=Annulohypoxylon truncatum TaxID=327061 RepID=UPI0020071F7A|nr:ribosomal protein S18 [Annulohypoxylon truncatum]KAI1211613.1 ribosomal protein S18 [Annulohypoxylon truncatum]
MPPRIPILAALRQPSTFFRPQRIASISTTAPTQSLRPNPGAPTATSQLLDIDNSSSDNGDNSSPSPYTPPKPSPPGSGSTSATQVAAGIYEDIYDNLRGTRQRARTIDEEIKQRNQNDEYARQMTRRWKAGDVYAPHDISPVEMGKWRRNQSRKKDLVDMLGLSPLDMYRNFSVISEFMTPHGRIKKSIETGLRPPNQRKLAKAIRRAVGLGLHPSVHKHPELLVRETYKFYEQNAASKRDYR